MNSVTISMPPSDENFAAHAEERLYAASTDHDPRAPRRIWAVLAAAAIYLLFAAVIAIEARFPPAIVPPEQEIPIEIVTAPPEPPPPPPQASPPSQQLDETEAHDAPRAGTSKTDDSGTTEKEAKAAPAAPAPDASAERVSGAEAEAKAPTPQAATVPDVAPPTPETPPLPETNGDAPPPNPKQAMSAPAAPAKPAPAAGKPKPIFDSVPDVDFGGAAKMAAVSGGMAKATYLSIVYGMIMPHIHRPPGAPAVGPKIKGTVVFSIDGRGRLLERWVADTSGSPDLDRAVFDAIGAASPYPPPPHGGTIQLRFVYGGS